MNKKHIEDQARQLRKEIWDRRNEIWKHEILPLEAINAEAACIALGIAYEEREDLGNFGFKGNRFKIAGMVDRQAGKIAVATIPSSEIMRFTAAHELGHYMLHKKQTMFRDQPINNTWNYQSSGKTPEEKEADYFSACFLMPKKHLKQYFKVRFLTTQFHFDDDSSFRLNPTEYEALLCAEEGSMDRAIALAKCESYNGQRFHSLAKQFRVSVSAMAIRLEELGLIKWP
jgi:Zn-dependent peptidase ImmA (M78 family)